MTSSFDPSALPLAVRALVERALLRGEGREAAILALEERLGQSEERDPSVLLALATLTYEDAATVMLHRLTTASETALELVDEAIARGGEPDDELIGLRATFARALERERARERRLKRLLEDPRGARPTELIELAHRILLSGEDDELAAELMAVAAEG